MKYARLAAVQMTSGDDPTANCEAAAVLAERAAEDHADIVVLPENFAALSGNAELRRRVAEEDGTGPVQDFVASLARRLGVWLVAGTIPIRGGDSQRPCAACCVYDNAGRRVARYDKIHLFDVTLPDRGESFRESANTGAGERPVAVDTPWGRLGLAVCYDLRFPELFRALAAGTMDLLAVPAAFTRPTGEAHWHTLVRARAIENLCYVAAAAQTGRHPGGRSSFGHSMIVDPWGEVLCDAGEEAGVIVAGADPARLNRIRRRFPVLSHRRLRRG